MSVNHSSFPVGIPQQAAAAPAASGLSGQWLRLKRGSPAPAWLLFFLSPLFAELLPGMSPFYEYLSPAGFIAAQLTYGIGAVLLREWAVRRGIGVWGRLPLGLVFCIFIEGLILKNIFAPEHYDLPFLNGYSYFLGINWHWLLTMSVWHTLLSLLLPWMLTEMLMPQHRNTPALSPRAMKAMLLLLAVLAVYCYFNTPMNWLGDIYVPNILVTFAAWGSVWWLLLKSLRVREPAPRRGRALHPWLLGLLTMLGWSVWWIGLTFLAALGPLAHRAALTVLMQVTVIALALAIAWSQRGLLTERHQFALLFCSIPPFVLLGMAREKDPEQFLFMDPSGMTGIAIIFGCAALLLRVYLGLRQRREARLAASTTART